MLRNSKATFVRKFVVKTFKNSQIWSHWKRQAFRLEPIFNSNDSKQDWPCQMIFVTLYALVANI